MGQREMRAAIAITLASAFFCFYSQEVAAQEPPPAAPAANDEELCLSEVESPTEMIVPCTRLLGTSFGTARIPYLLARGRAYVAEQQFQAAEKDFTQALELDPKNTQSLYERGVFYVAQKKYDLALADLNRLLEIDPNDADGLYSRAFIFSVLDKDKEAIGDLTKLLSLHPDDAESYNDRGGLYLREGDMKAAIADYDQAIAHNKDYNEALYNRGRAHLLMGEDKKAVQDFRAALKLRPHNPYIALRLALAGDESELKPTLKELEKDRWPAPLLQFYLGDVPPEDIFTAIASLKKDRANIETEAAYYIGSFFLKKGEKEKAINYFSHAQDDAKSVIEFYDIRYLRGKK